ncbi:alkylhydroperoxidase AhpD family core domain-containing protein [Parapedobacter composti]|uniref:Alkylhydroperoxidase AhpD family core domain-containing protein n=1 Tax=Parapedobacter composti TaxID=623281 RepID=A0A1I1MAZ3_9SPHI|nr:carboxymuconolactone decarboxylase family protein [Parapedobacter composti]SFC82256.1 alkylhydroperoxidase AhpD family core domain-containing protein [Parapedobacter composti]
MKERITFQDYPAGLLDGMRKTQDYIDNSGLDHGLLELVYMRVSQINSCAYCIDMHYKKGLHYGETPLRLISVSAWRETPYYTEKEQAALAFAERLTHMLPEEHSHDIHLALEKHFTKQEISVLSLAVAQINSWNRLMRSFGAVPGNFEIGT